MKKIMISGSKTAAHEAMHAASLIYYIIKYYKEDSTDSLDYIFKSVLGEASIIINEEDESAGYFTHYIWGRYTKEADVYCSFSGFIGGYVFTGSTESNDLNHDWKKDLSTLLWWYNSEYATKEKVELDYKIFGAGKDLKSTGIEDHSVRLKYIIDVMKLLRKSENFQNLFLDIMSELQNKHVLSSQELTNLANKHKDSILMETRANRIMCISLGDSRPEYSYYAV